MTIPESVREAAGRFAMTESIGGDLFPEDLELVATWAVPLIQSGKLPSQEVIDAIRRVIRSASEDRRRVYHSEIGEALDLYHADVELIDKWLAKVEQKEGGDDESRRSNQAR